MINIPALMNALPVSSLEPEWVAILYGFMELPKGQEWRGSIQLLEPPAGQHVPYIKPLKALVVLLSAQGIAPDEAKMQAREVVAKMRDEVPENRWVNFLDPFTPESPDCLPLPEFVKWLRDRQLVPPDIPSFFEQAAEVSASLSMFYRQGNRDAPWPLARLPELPPPHAMIEFIGAPWADIDAWGDPDTWQPGSNPFVIWREAIRPVAQQLEVALGQPVYDFADLTNEMDDDYVHRFLVLHWCCTYKPESAFVKYLLKASGANDVEELKAALIDPASYTQPFMIEGYGTGLELLSCRINYLPPDQHKTVAVLFSTQQARNVAQALLWQRIRAHAVILAPKELATDEWIKQATRYCSGYTLWYLDEHTLDRQPIEILASTDELCVIANEKTPNSGPDLKLSEGAENLLWLALSLCAEARYFSVDRRELSNPDTCLKEVGVPARVAASKVQRTAFTRQLKELRLDNDYGSSGLWDEKGKVLRYDLLDLPLPLFRRIAVWQQDYDETIDPPDMGDDDWWDAHTQEGIEIARALQDTLGPNVPVKLYRQAGWRSIDDIERELNTKTSSRHPY